MKFTRLIKKESKNFGGLPFWSWNDKLEKKELLRQIHNIKDIGLTAFLCTQEAG